MPHHGRARRRETCRGGCVRPESHVECGCRGRLGAQSAAGRATHLRVLLDAHGQQRQRARGEAVHLRLSLRLLGARRGTAPRGPRDPPEALRANPTRGRLAATTAGEGSPSVTPPVTTHRPPSARHRVRRSLVGRTLGDERVSMLGALSTGACVRMAEGSVTWPLSIRTLKPPLPPRVGSLRCIVIRPHAEAPHAAHSG